MEKRKKQILLDELTEYNKTVNDMSKFKLNTKEENLFCDIMQKYAEEYHTEQLRQYNVVGQSEQFKCHSCGTNHSGKNDDQLFEICKTCFDGI